jgi:hypothetical protein
MTMFGTVSGPEVKWRFLNKYESYSEMVFCVNNIWGSAILNHNPELTYARNSCSRHSYFNHWLIFKPTSWGSTQHHRRRTQCKDANQYCKTCLLPRVLRLYLHYTIPRGEVFEMQEVKSEYTQFMLVSSWPSHKCFELVTLWKLSYPLL